MLVTPITPTISLIRLSENPLLNEIFGFNACQASMDANSDNEAKSVLYLRLTDQQRGEVERVRVDGSHQPPTSPPTI